MSSKRLFLSLLAALGSLPMIVQASPFSDYWNHNAAELTSYDLEQARYGDVHSGHAVLIFVTEPFSADKQVKVDQPTDAAVPVLKLNLTKKFNTGIYPYSMMLSVFTPIDAARYPRALKATTSSQEWCGHTFTQLNLRDGTYQGERYSYFDSEGDQTFTAGNATLEDEIWTRIRLSPENLPTGKIEMIPGGLYARLGHRLQQPEHAVATLTRSPAPAATAADATGSETPLSVYTLEYPELKRILTIRFEDRFPYRIDGWEETGPNGFGKEEKISTTRATLRKRIMLDYWNKHHPEDRDWREKLGLPES